MKNDKILLMIFLSFLLTGMEGCKKDQVEYPEAEIVRELPLMTLSGCNTEISIVRSQKELEAMFQKDELQTVGELRQVDFSKYSLLLGCHTFESSASLMELHL